jgi:hypothetical protein
MQLNELSPVVIGGVGGSGTRVVAEFLMKSGYAMGEDLNNSNDNLLFTLLFKRLSILCKTAGEMERILGVFVKIMHGQPLDDGDREVVDEAAREYFKSHETSWVQERIEAIGKQQGVGTLWGWKEPNAHIVLEALHAHLPKMKYIHVMRSGLDMAYSENQTQLKLWGRNLLSREEVPVTPRFSLKYWCRVHERVLKIVAERGIDFHLVDFDRMCLGDASEREGLVAFLGMEHAASERLGALLKAPASIGRHWDFPEEAFDAEDRRCAERFAQLKGGDAR